MIYLSDSKLKDIIRGTYGFYAGVPTYRASLFLYAMPFIVPVDIDDEDRWLITDEFIDLLLERGYLLPKPGMKDVYIITDKAIEFSGLQDIRVLT